MKSRFYRTLTMLPSDALGKGPSRTLKLFMLHYFRVPDISRTFMHKTQQNNNLCLLKYVLSPQVLHATHICIHFESLDLQTIPTALIEHMQNICLIHAKRTTMWVHLHTHRETIFFIIKIFRVYAKFTNTVVL